MSVTQFILAEACLMKVRNALFNDAGVDKDVLEGASAFAKYDRNDLNLIIEDPLVP